MSQDLGQIDGTESPLAGGEAVKIINVLDDASRKCVGSQAHPGETLAGAWTTLIGGASVWGFPERLLSDNGRSFKALERPLAAILNQFTIIYNEQRPHRSINRQTPSNCWNQLSKSGPADRPLNLDGHHIVDRTVATN